MNKRERLKEGMIVILLCAFFASALSPLIWEANALWRKISLVAFVSVMVITGIILAVMRYRDDK